MLRRTRTRRGVGHPHPLAKLAQAVAELGAASGVGRQCTVDLGLNDANEMLSTVSSWELNARLAAPVRVSDGATLVSAGAGRAVRLWNTAPRQRSGTAEPLGPNQDVEAWFDGPGKVLIAYEQGDTFEWDTNPDAWEAEACSVAGRNLTQADWAALLPGRPCDPTCPQYPAGS